MDNQARSLKKFHFGASWRISTIAVSLAVAAALMVLTTQSLQAQTFNVIHTFTGGPDGAGPSAGVTIGGPGTLYGTAGGGNHDSGVVFKLAERNSHWTLTPLYEFTGGSDGYLVDGGVVIGPNGALYGTTHQGGNNQIGTVFELTQPVTVCTMAICYWSESVLHSFMGLDGAYPGFGNLTLDRAGHIYGPASLGGRYEGGVAFELSQSGGQWTESVLHSFGNGHDGSFPAGGLVFDSAGNLYGNTANGGNGGGGSCGPGCGTVYQLTPSHSGWTENILLSFNDATGEAPESTLIIDHSGNLYGTTPFAGPNGGGTVFELTPSNGSWTFSLLYAFSTCSPNAGVTMDAAGNLYGVCTVGGKHPEWGMVFKLTNSANGWMLTDLYDFTGGADGCDPMGPVAIDNNGNLYGTTQYGGNSNCYGGAGVVWEITP